MTRYPEYPKYKPSGVAWLGDVPEHWVPKAIKWTTPVQRGASPRPIDDPVYFDEEGEYAWVRIADVTASDTYLENTTQRLSDIGSSLSVKLVPGKLFLSIAATVGVPCITKIKCCIHDGFVYFPRLSADTKFMYYIFACGEPYRGLGKLGTQLNLNTDTVGSIVVGFPPFSEQQSIAAFLDRETGKIDTLISKNQKLVELLREKRTAMISRAVTKGLNPKVKMKPSGVAWLGDVPENWEVKRLDFLASVKARLGWKGLTADEYVLEGNIFLSTPNIKGESDIDFVNVNYISNERYYESPEIILKQGDVILAKDGSTLGTVNWVKNLPGPATVNSSLAVIRPKSSLNSTFLFRWISSTGIQSLISKYKDGQGVPHLFQSDIRKFTVILPPLSEQQSIVAFLDRETGKIDTLIGKVKTAIAKLKEYRTALISAAVTGKIDVRTAGVA